MSNQVRRQTETERNLKSQSVALLDTIDLRRSCKYCSNTSSKVVSLPRQALTRPVLSVYCLLFNDLHNDELAQSTGRQQQFIPFQKSNARFQQPPKGCHFLDTIRGLTLTAVLTFRSDQNNSRMEVALVSYANTYADVVDHVVFGVDPPANADFFRLLSGGFGRICRINRRIRLLSCCKTRFGPRLTVLGITAHHTRWTGKNLPNRIFISFAYRRKQVPKLNLQPSYVASQPPTTTVSVRRRHYTF